MTSPSDLEDPATPLIDEGAANGRIQPGRYYGQGIPYLPIEGYPGKLIAIEGTDGVGAARRSSCCANGWRSKATASSKPGGRARR